MKKRAKKHAKRAGKLTLNRETLRQVGGGSIKDRLWNAFWLGRSKAVCTSIAVECP